MSSVSVTGRLDFYPTGGKGNPDLIDSAEIRWDSRASAVSRVLRSFDNFSVNHGSMDIELELEAGRVTWTFELAKFFDSNPTRATASDWESRLDTILDSELISFKANIQMFDSGHVDVVVKPEKNQLLEFSESREGDDPVDSSDAAELRERMGIGN